MNNMRIVWLSVSATKIRPAASETRPVGLLNLATDGPPSALPGLPATPLIVVTIDDVSNIRMVWFPESATSIVEAPVAYTPLGERNLPVGNCPSEAPGGPIVPANVCRPSDES